MYPSHDGYEDVLLLPYAYRDTAHIKFKVAFDMRQGDIHSPLISLLFTLGYDHISHSYHIQGVNCHLDRVILLNLRVVLVIGISEQQFVLTVPSKRNDRMIHSSFLQTHHLFYLQISNQNDKTVHLDFEQTL